MYRLSLALAAAAIVAATVHTAAQQSTARAVARSAPSTNGRFLPGTRGNLFPTIRGNALNSTNGALPNAPVRLRDARFGRVVDTQTTDNAGMFTFTTIDPGSYIVEVVGADDSVLAASQIINVNAGDAVTAIVKLPFRVPPFASVLGHTAPSAVAVTSEAVASGVLATTVAGRPVSPTRP